METFYDRKKQFRIGSSNFSLDACKWSSVNFHRKKVQGETNQKAHFTMPYSRLHKTSVVLHDHIYMFGGTTLNLENQVFCAINLKNNKWHSLNNASNPKPRDSHGMTILKNQIYLFGGSDSQNSFNDLHSFNNFTNVWSPIEAMGNVPQERDPMIFLAVNQQYLLLVGGINIKSKALYEDSYVWKDGVWTSMTVQGYPIGLVGAKATYLNGRILVFGGTKIHKSQPQHFNSMYQIMVMQEQSKIKFKKIEPLFGISPQGRVGHQLLTINQQYMMVIAGQQMGKKVLKDIWVYDIFSNRWFRIQPKNGPLMPMHSFSGAIYNNSIYFIGGYVDYKKEISNQVSVLAFAEQQIFKSEVCQNCVIRAHKKEQDSKKVPKTLSISVGFLYNVALQIKFPFHAISMLYETAKYLKANYFRFTIEKTISNFDFLKLQFDGRTFQREQFINFISQKSGFPELKKCAQRLKLGSFRLGKTMILISADKKFRNVFLLSADSRVIPHFDQIYNYCAYIQNIQLQRIDTQEGMNSRALVSNVLKSHIKNPEYLLNTTQKSVLLIFQNKVVMTAQKTYFHQLIFHQNQNDVKVFKSQKKMQFLEERGYQISKEAEISLNTFMSLYTINSDNYPQFYFNDSTQSVPTFSYKKTLKIYQSSRLIIRTEMPKVQGLQINGQLFVCASQELIRDNFGLLLYGNNRLFSRYDIQFGLLFSKHFYKSKYKKAKTIFYELGYLNIIGLQQNFYRCGFVKSQKYLRLMQQIQRVCRQSRRQRQQISIQDVQEQSKSSKKVKIN